jgi:16S rRNA (cytosine967-C5)-methyltransferase
LPLWKLLQAAAQSVQAVQAGRSLTAALDELPAEVRPGAQALSFTALRRLGRAQALREGLAARKPPAAADALLCTALALAWPEQGAPYPLHTLVNQAVEAARRQRSLQPHSGFINACLRRFVREQAAWIERTDADPRAQWNHPLWWVERLRKDHPQDWQGILLAAQESAPMTLRVNRARAGRDDYRQRLLEQGMTSVPVGEDGLQLSRPVSVHSLPGFELGHASVQDAAAQMAAPLLLQGLPAAPRILDACAAPGGKTGHLLEIAPQAHVLALDVDARRCERIHQNLQRLGVSAQVLAADAAHPSAWWDGQAFDGILLDAPCTASGIGRRHPDVRWLRRPTDVPQLADIQRRLLQVLWPLLQSGGRMLYCTCSVFKAEGDDNIRAFLERNTDAVLQPSPGHLLPPTARTDGSLGENAHGEHDGFYYALLEKRSP